MTKTDHLAKARDYIAKGEGCYRKAAEEIIAAQRAEPGLGYRKIAERIGRSEHWCRKLVQWSTTATDASQTPFGGPEENEARYQRADRRKVDEIARERPEAVAEAITKAPPEAQRKIADELIKAPNTERSLRNIAKRSSEPAPSREPKPIERRLGEATFSLWEIGEALLDEVPTAEERFRMLTIAEKAQRLAAGIVYLLDTGELEDEFRKLVEEVGADA